MKGEWLLAWRYVSYHRLRSVVLAICVLLAALLPVTVKWLVGTYTEKLEARARATPLVAGAPGSRYDLVLGALYFRGRPPAPTSMAEAERITDGELATPYPLLSRRSAKGFAVVGTTHDYYGFRGLDFAAGGPPAVLGEAVLGTEVARRLNLSVGDKLLTDRGSLYDLAAGYPLRLKIAGVLAECDQPENSAVLVDLKTAWIVEGIGHGHDDAREVSEDARLKSRADEVVLDASVVEYEEVTSDNISSFHFHSAPEDLPLTAILVDPKDAKSATLLKGRYAVDAGAQLLVPTEVVAELSSYVFRLKRFFDANTALVTLSTILFLALVVILDLRARRRELITLKRIGCARSTTARIFALELLFTAGTGLALALLASAALVWGATHWAWTLP